MGVAGAMSTRRNLELNLIGNILAQWSPTFLAPGTSFMEDPFYHRQGCVWGDGFGMIQAYSIYCALYFSYYYILFTSDHQVLDPGD